MIIDFATMLQTIRQLNTDLFNDMQQTEIGSENIIDSQEDDTKSVSTEYSNGSDVSSNGSDSSSNVSSNVTDISNNSKTETNNKDEPEHKLFNAEDVSPIEYKKGEKETILKNKTTGKTIATMEVIDIRT